MNKLNSGFLALTAILFLCVPSPQKAGAEELKWLDWSDTVFARAKKENKFVLLDLGAVWCHWCHVMDETTYVNKDVIALLNKKYLVVRVDQDARPDLSNRYEDYGWPATIVFAADGSEIVKRRGFINPREMTALLKAIIEDPSPGPSVRAEKKASYEKTATVPKDRIDGWTKILFDEYEFDVGGWAGTHKWLDWDNVEFAMQSAGDPRADKIVSQMLGLQHKLLDPVWGGSYQYSAEGDWEHPHFEKIMQMQAENMRICALGFERGGGEENLRTAKEIHRYLRAFLTSPDGVVYTSQDADVVQGEHSGEYFALDDTQRRAKGVPRVDKHIYARENGWVIVALVEMFAATSDKLFLDEASAAANWILNHRSLPGGGFRHDETDAAGPYLGDTLAMGRAFLRLYAATGDRIWLSRADAAAKFIAENFQRADGAPGLMSAKTTGMIAPPRPQFEENVSLSRFANLLHRHTGKKEHRVLAELAFRYASSPEIADERGAVLGALLLAARELAAEPLHLVVVGKKDDPAAAALIQAALKVPNTYKQVEWFDRREGPLAGVETGFPELPHAAAFICANGACSAPVNDASTLLEKVARVSSPVNH